MKIRTFAHFIDDGLRSAVRNRLMSSASIITVTAALFILGIFMAIVMNVNNIAGSVTSKIEIEGFLKSDYTLSEQRAIESTISGIKGVTKIDYISKQQALQNFKAWLGDNQSLANGLDSQNPLPASYKIKVDKPEDVVYVADQLKSMNIFDKINDGKEIVDKVIRITGFIKYASLVLMLILGIVSVSLIANTIKLTVYARKKEIGIMKYIGATDWFIRWPFIIEGISLGLIGALISILLIWISYSYASSVVSKNWVIFSLVTTRVLLDNITMVFCLIGALIGGVGSILSIRRFLVK